MDTHSDTRPPTLDIVIPVYNEESAIVSAITTLTRYLKSWDGAPSYRITVADNASTDNTLSIAQAMAARDPHIRPFHLDRKGRGRALRTVWLQSDADILIYMDVDLATDLAALPPLVAPLLSGQAHLAIGTRLHRDSRVVRGPRREFISRTYNHIIHLSTGAHFSDAQCGFKAITREAAQIMLPHVTDNAWFFDTELLLMADYCGLRIAEIPVDWVDDPQSSVNVTCTARDDLIGLARVLRERATHRIPRNHIHDALVSPLHSQVGRSAQLTDSTGQQVILFGVVGVASTILQSALYWIFSLFSGAFLSTMVSLILSTLFNTSANRTFTFGVRDKRSLSKNHMQNLLVTLLTAAVQWIGAEALASDGTGTTGQTLWIAASGIALGVVRFAAMKWWMFRHGAGEADAAADAADSGAADGSHPLPHAVHITGDSAATSTVAAGTAAPAHGPTTTGTATAAHGTGVHQTADPGVDTTAATTPVAQPHVDDTSLGDEGTVGLFFDSRTPHTLPSVTGSVTTTPGTMLYRPSPTTTDSLTNHSPATRTTRASQEGK